MTPSEGGGRNTMIIAIVAILIVAGLAVWATTRKPTAGTSGSATVSEKNDEADVNLKVDLPDSVTIDAH